MQPLQGLVEHPVVSPSGDPHRLPYASFRPRVDRYRSRSLAGPPLIGGPLVLLPLVKGPAWGVIGSHVAAR
ncbi:hypothetical protein [Streptomyces sp. NPDC047046]|uniref:hypothetical protein n=1 Tax=Streptomyces sp. NPDC047046 TaxID=3155378 RepID=UPI0033D4FD21